MKVLKIFCFIFLIFASVIGVIYDIYPLAIPMPLFYATWVVSILAFILLGIILLVKKKRK